MMMLFKSNVCILVSVYIVIGSGPAPCRVMCMSIGLVLVHVAEKDILPCLHDGGMLNRVCHFDDRIKVADGIIVWALYVWRCSTSRIRRSTIMTRTSNTTHKHVRRVVMTCIRPFL
jgi:hypothetical protein